MQINSEGSMKTDFDHEQSRAHGRKQNRGKKLEDKLRTLLADWCREITGSGRKWVYTQAAFAKYAGVSRETIRSKQLHLDGLIAELDSSRRLSNGSVGLKQAVASISNLKNENADLKAQIYSLQIQHVRMFEKLYKKARNLSVLVEGDLPFASIGHCPLCGCTNRNQ